MLVGAQVVRRELVKRQQWNQQAGELSGGSALVPSSIFPPKQMTSQHLSEQIAQSEREQRGLV